MQKLDEKDAALGVQRVQMQEMAREMEALRGRAARLDTLEGNCSRAVYEALGLVEHVQALEALVECVVLEAQTKVAGAEGEGAGGLDGGAGGDEVQAARETMIQHLKLKVKNLQWEVSRSHRDKTEWLNEMEAMKMEERRTQLELQHLGDERNGLKAEVMLLRQEAAQHAAESERTRRPGTELTSLPTDKFDLQPTGGRGGRGEQSEGVGEGGGPRRAARASQRVAGNVAAQRREQQSESERQRDAADKRKPLAVIAPNRPGTLRYSCAHTLTPAPRHPHLRTQICRVGKERAAGKMVGKSTDVARAGFGFIRSRLLSGTRVEDELLALISLTHEQAHSLLGIDAGVGNVYLVHWNSYNVCGI